MPAPGAGALPDLGSGAEVGGDRGPAPSRLAGRPDKACGTGSAQHGPRPAPRRPPVSGARKPVASLAVGGSGPPESGAVGGGPRCRGVAQGDCARGREHGSRDQSLPVCWWPPRRVQAAAARAASPPGAGAASHPGPHWLPSSPTRHYDIRRNDDIINFFNDFSDHLAEEALWELSLKIKPRNITRRKTDREEKT